MRMTAEQKSKLIEILETEEISSLSYRTPPNALGDIGISIQGKLDETKTIRGRITLEGKFMVRAEIEHKP